jgi:hypothetical protein
MKAKHGAVLRLVFFTAVQVGCFVGAGMDVFVVALGLSRSDVRLPLLNCVNCDLNTPG